MKRFLDIALILLASQLSTMGWPHYGVTWDDLIHPATVLNLGPTNPPERVFWLNDGGTSPGVLALGFEDQVVAGNEEQVWYVAQMPHGWLEGSTTDPHNHWQLEDTTDCNVRWCLEYVLLDVNEAQPATTSTSCADCPSGGDGLKHLCNFFANGLDMTGYRVSALVSSRIYRNSSHANDTCDGKDAWLHTSDIHFQKDRPGSRNTTTK